MFLNLDAFVIAPRWEYLNKINVENVETTAYFTINLNSRDNQFLQESNVSWVNEFTPNGMS